MQRKKSLNPAPKSSYRIYKWLISIYLFLSIYTATPPREDFVQESLRVKQISKKFKRNKCRAKDDRVKMLNAII